MVASHIGSVFHPSDFSRASEVAFVHALKIALVSGAKLNMLHVDPSYQAHWTDFPGVRDTLARWGLVPEGSSRRAVLQCGIDVRKIIASSPRPIQACLAFLTRHPADLIVLAVHRDAGRLRWLEKRVGEPIARKAGKMTLYIPHGIPGFVSRLDGSVALRHILVPIAERPRAQPALEATVMLLRSLELSSAAVTLLHVGASAEAPAVKLPTRSGCTWSIETRMGEPVEVILRTADAARADLIVMTTEGPHGFLDALRGSTSERVVREARCPVLSLPVEPS